jgi:hypothetical protein
MIWNTNSHKSWHLMVMCPHWFLCWEEVMKEVNVRRSRVEDRWDLSSVPSVELVCKSKSISNLKNWLQYSPHFFLRKFIFSFLWIPCLNVYTHYLILYFKFLISWV